MLQLVRDGHLTDGSVGYRSTGPCGFPRGEQAAIRGRVFDGPLKVSHMELKDFQQRPSARTRCKGAQPVYRPARPIGNPQPA